jgi:surface polysaccharide O-acyltransferase-like enzyme
MEQALTGSPGAGEGAARPPAAKKPPRDAGIELGRIFCCYCVILIHLNAFYSSLPLVSAVWSVAKCASTPVFFLIAGYFFDARKPFSQYMGRITARVLIPTVVVMLLIAQFTPWLSSQGTILDCLKGPNLENFLRVLQIVVTQWPYLYIEGYNPFISLWFTFSLFLCYLCIPILKVICAEEKASRWLKGYILWMGALFFVLRVSVVVAFPDNYWAQHLDWWIEQKPFYWLWLMTLGHELHRTFRDRELLDRIRARLCLASLFVYLAGAIALWSLTMAFNVAPDGLVNQRFYAREFVVYLVAQLGMFVFFVTLDPGRGPLSRAILFVADKTFYVYVTHEAVYHKLLDLTGLDTDRLGQYLLASVLTFAVALGLGVALTAAERRVARALGPRLKGAPGPRGPGAAPA